MESFLRNLFQTNEVILIAVYGQAFFVLGLAIALQWRQESRLELARAVPLLAAFGLAKAFAIWADSFIPLQEHFLSSSELNLLRLFQLLLMLVAFTFLLHFGARLNWNSPWTPRLPWAMAVAIAVFLGIGYASNIPIDHLRLLFEQVARPLFVLTGAMFAAWGLRNTAAQVDTLGLPRHIVAWLRVAGIAFGAYAIFGGLLVPLSIEQVQAVNLAPFGVPVALPRLLAVAVLAWAMIRALTIFRIEIQRAMEEMARLRALGSDRQRIGRELHDGTIQVIYGAGLLLENAVSYIESDPEAAERMIRDSMSLLNKTIVDVRRVIFELSAGEGQLAEALGALVNEMRQQSGREIVYRLEGNLPRYPADVRDHLLNIAREAITNALKHSDATEISLSLKGEPDALVLAVTDNGRGLPAGGAFRPGGQGVPNLRARAALVGGSLRLFNRPGGGVTVELVAPHGSGASGRGSIIGSEAYEASTSPAG
jgi:signal transduction histidine kinase